MDVSALRELVRDVEFGVHGVAAVVTPPSAAPVATLVIWMTDTSEAVPVGSGFTRKEPRRILAIRRDEVPAVPRGTIVEVAEHTQTSPAIWRVDAMESVFPDHHRVVVVPYDVEA